jgi:HNH endonuclease
MDARTTDRFMSKVEKTDDCWYWKGTKHRFGYGMFNYKNSMTTAHRVSYMLHKGTIPEGLMVRHKCRGLCVNPDHLELGTHKDNMADKRRDGTIGYGERNGKAKLTADQVRDIRSRVGQLRKDIAKEFGVCVPAITNIINRKRWIHI